MGYFLKNDWEDGLIVIQHRHTISYQHTMHFFFLITSRECVENYWRILHLHKSGATLHSRNCIVRHLTLHVEALSLSSLHCTYLWNKIMENFLHCGFAPFSWWWYFNIELMCQVPILIKEHRTKGSWKLCNTFVFNRFNIKYLSTHAFHLLTTVMQN